MAIFSLRINLCKKNVIIKKLYVFKVHFGDVMI
jgi:hypothetical protein